MASVTVFVDDAVRGTLPGVCARDGVTTADALGRHEPVGNRAGIGIAWLLVFAGPLGWLALLVIALSKGGRIEQLHLQLPMSEPAYQRLRDARRTRDRALLAFVASSIAVLFLFAGQDTTLTQFALVAAVAIAAVSLVAMITGSVRCDRETIAVTLDASRRWVTLSNVHPQFVAACEAHEASQVHRT